MINDKLTKIRELVDELYDNTQPHNSTNSMLFLEINQAIDEAQKECKHYIKGTDLDLLIVTNLNFIRRQSIQTLEIVKHVNVLQPRFFHILLEVFSLGKMRPILFQHFQIFGFVFQKRG